MVIERKGKNYKLIQIHSYKVFDEHLFWSDILDQILRLLFMLVSAKKITLNLMFCG